MQQKAFGTGTNCAGKNQFLRFGARGKISEKCVPNVELLCHGNEPAPIPEIGRGFTTAAW